MCGGVNNITILHIFTTNDAIMKTFKLIVLTAVCFALIITLPACEKQPDREQPDFYTKDNIPGTGAQIAPVASPSTGTASLSISYDRKAKLLNYIITWTGLSDSVIAVRVSGPSPAGYSALRLPFVVAAGDSSSINTTPYIVLQQNTGTASRALAPASGSFTGALTVDGYKVTEENLLNQFYYVTLHTKTILPIPGAGRFLYRWFGEVRAQIAF